MLHEQCSNAAALKLRSDGDLSHMDAPSYLTGEFTREIPVFQPQCGDESAA